MQKGSWGFKVVQGGSRWFIRRADTIGGIGRCVSSQRAMRVEVGLEASYSGPIYLGSLLNGVRKWRGFCHKFEQRRLRRCNQG